MAEAAAQQVLTDAVAAGDVPFVVAMVTDPDRTTFNGSAGGIAPDSIFRAYSMSKAVAGLAAAILIDRGELSLDTYIADILPEFGSVKVLEGFDGDTPVLREPRTACTVRHLASHTSGFVYEFWNTDIFRYRKAVGLPSVMTGRLEALAYPLAFDPGSRWDYGIGVDWLGRVVEKVSGRQIDRFCDDEIFGPLGMKDTLFEIDEARLARLAPAFARQPDGSFAPRAMAPVSRPEFYGMGHALYTTAADFVRLLKLILNGGTVDGTRLISEEACRMMLANHIGELRVGPLKTALPSNSSDVDRFPEVAKTHSLLGIRVEEDVPGMRRAGSQGWAGVLNTHWWIDPASRIAGVFMTQLSPFYDPRCMAAFDSFEQAVYATLPRP